MGATFTLGSGVNSIAFRGRLAATGGGAGGASLKLESLSPEGIGIVELVKALGNNTSLSPVLSGLPRITNLELRYGSDGDTSTFTVIFDSVLKINGAEFKATIACQSSRTGSTYSGTINMGGHNLGFRVVTIGEGERKGSYLLASYDYDNKQDGELNLKQIAGSIFPADVANAVPNVGIKLKKFRAYLLYGSGSSGSLTLFGMAAGIGPSSILKGLPLVGDSIAAENSFSIEELGIALANQELTAADIKLFNPAGSDKPILPVGGVSKSFNLSATVLMGEEKKTFDLIAPPGDNQVTNNKKTLPADGISNASAPVEPTPANNGGTQGSDNTPAATPTDTGERSLAAAVKWMELKKTLGPLELQRLGAAYADGKIGLFFDAAITLSVLRIQLLGLGFGFKLGWPPDLPPDFYLSGLGLTYKSGPIEISGVFVRVQTDPGKLEFYGAILIKLTKFTIVGLGAYSSRKITTKQPDGTERTETLTSMFLYAVYSGPIGGPAFFFVTGIAIGFGYNRRVRAPKISEVNDFPLVAVAIETDKKKSLAEIQKDLIDQNWIPESAGDYWLAAGIKFTSFKIIDSFVLLIAQFGTRMEFTIVGLSVLKMPVVGTDTNLVYVELALLARFSPQSDKITVEAAITPNSYLFDKNCKLTGGFAFYAWVSGAYEGDFVITLGGYHPEYKKPAHYPVVERLGLQWKLSDIVSISGEMYFTLTPKAIMAGGRWEVSCNLGFLQASVTIWANVIIAWAPLYYKLNAGVQVKIAARIKVIAAYVNFRVQVGAQLTIWGPPFAGNIFVDWAVFSFTIPFGSKTKEVPKPLTWAEFSKQYVPEKAEEVANLKITAGLQSEYTETTANRKIFIVSPYGLTVAWSSFFPLATVKAPVSGAVKELGADTLLNKSGADAPVWRGAVMPATGIKPMSLASQETTCTATIIDKTTGAIIANELEIVLQAKGMVSALWGTGADGEPDVLKNIITGVQLRVKERQPGRQEVLAQAEQAIITGNAVIGFALNANTNSTIGEQDPAKKTDMAGVASFFNKAGFELSVEHTPVFGKGYPDGRLFHTSIGEAIPSKRNA